MHDGTAPCDHPGGWAVSQFRHCSREHWKVAVRSAVAAAGVQPQDARFAVRMEFRVAVSQNANEVWDLDNLIKPTLDAM